MTKSAFYKIYNDRISKESEWKAMLRQKESEICDLKKKNYQAENQLAALYDKMGDLDYYVVDHGYDKRLGLSIGITSHFERELLANETLTFNFLYHFVRKAAYDIVHGTSECHMIP